MNTTNPAIRNIISDTVSASYTSTLILDTKSIGLVSKYGNNEEELRKDRQFKNVRSRASMDFDNHGHRRNSGKLFCRYAKSNFRSYMGICF